jgi:SnoaL-like protein
LSLVEPERGPGGLAPAYQREAVAGFFQDIQEDFEMNSFKPHSFLEGEGRVAVVIEVDLTVKSTGKRLQDEEIHLWEFGSDGKVVSHRHFLDTGKGHRRALVRRRFGLSTTAFPLRRYRSMYPPALRALPLSWGDH